MISFHKMAIYPELKRRLERQNPLRTEVADQTIKTRVFLGKGEFVFNLLEGKESPANSAGPNPYRVEAYYRNPERPLFLRLVGRFDYYVTLNSPGPNTAHSYKAHSPKKDDSDMGMVVFEEARKHFRGIGRALASIGLNHAASDGAVNFFFSDVIAVDFIYSLTSGPKQMQNENKDPGKPADDIETDPSNLITNIESAISKEKYLPQILISKRSMPLKEVRHWIIGFP